MTGVSPRSVRAAEAHRQYSEDELIKDNRELRREVAALTRHFGSLEEEIARAKREGLRPHFVLGRIFGGEIVVNRAAMLRGAADLIYPLPTGLVGVRVSLGDLSLSEGVNRVEEPSWPFPDYEDSRLAMAEFAYTPTFVAVGDITELDSLAEGAVNALRGEVIQENE